MCYIPPDPSRCDFKNVLGDTKRDTGKREQNVDHPPAMILNEITHPVVRKIREDSDHVLNIITEDEPSIKHSGVDPILLPNKG